MAKYYLTQIIVDQLLCPKGKTQDIVWDNPTTKDGKVRHGSQAGLGLRVTENGASSFVHSYMFNGLRKRIVLGKVSAMSLVTARRKVHEREQLITAGEDPDHGKINFRKTHSITLKEVINLYYAQHVAGLSRSHRSEFKNMVAPWVERIPLKKRGYKQAIKYKPFGERYGDVAMVHFNPQHIGAFISEFSSDNRSNAALRQLKALFNWAIRMQLVDMRNPCLAFRRRKIIRKRRDYDLEMIKDIVSYVFCPPLEVLPDVMDLDAKRGALLRRRHAIQQAAMIELCNFMGILLLTMARPNEVRSAEFSHFDLDKLVWHKHDTKGIKLSQAAYEYSYRSVPIHPKVGALITAQRERWPDSRFVFPSDQNPDQPRQTFATSFKHFKKLIDAPSHFQMYDLKRFSISLMMTGQVVSREAVSHYVDHKGNLETTMIYDLGLVEPLRPVSNKLGELLGV